MCGIVGLHLRNPDLYPRLGELLTGMLCEMGNRGSDSTGVAVYGDPTWSPPGRGGVSLVDVSDEADAVASALTERLGAKVDVVTVGTSYLLTADMNFGGPARRCQDGIPRGADRRVRGRHGRSQGSRRPADTDRRMGSCQGAGLAGGRSHEDGDRVRRDPCRLPSLHRGARAVHGAQRLIRQSRHHPAPTTLRGSRIRQRERYRSGRSLHRQAACRRPRRRVCAQGTLRDVRRLLHAAGVQPGLVRRRSRRHRVQACRDRRNRRLGGGRQRIPRSRRPSRRREGHHLGAGAGGDLRMERAR